MSRSFMRKWLGGGVTIVVLLAVAAASYSLRSQWLPWVFPESATPKAADSNPLIDEPKMLKLSPQARKNLGLVSKPALPQSYWRTIQLPGVIADRHGISDRGVTSPVEGVVTSVHAFAGDTVKPGDTLFTIRLLSEQLQTTQSELFKATGETQLIAEERARIEELARNGTIAGNRLIELNQRTRRQQGLIQGYEQALLRHGLNQSQIEQVAKGNFVTTMNVVAPPALKDGSTPISEIRPVVFLENEAELQFAYEVQELNVDLGQQVHAGELLSMLSNHRSLYIEGHAFKREASWLEQAASSSRPIEVEFAEDNAQSWPDLNQDFQIRHLANTIDPASRTLDFYIPLSNQARAYEKDGQTFVVWRFRPGQRLRLHVPVEQFENVIVLPSEAIAREGPETYVFRQNGDLFDRLPVHILHEDRQNVVIANDGSVTPGVYLAQGSAASLNRVLKAQAASGVKVNVHVHADGTVHESH
ncbi:MAG: efflux RND transporter periplasmic adaptor subunit [bacterium]|nr:efflux RND transporter periplasmic adaptor subunit [bacterium]